MGVNQIDILSCFSLIYFTDIYVNARYNYTARLLWPAMWYPITRGGGQSHSGGYAYVRLKRPPFSASLSPKDPYFFTIACALTQRPHDFLYFSLTECQISLTKCQICSPNAKFRSPNAPNPDFWPLSPHIFVFFCHRMPKIMLSPNDPSFFEPVLSPNAPACRSAGLTPVSISYLTAPPRALLHSYCTGT